MSSYHFMASANRFCCQHSMGNTGTAIKINTSMTNIAHMYKTDAKSGCSAINHIIYKVITYHSPTQVT